MPRPVIDFAIKGKRCTNAVVVAREKLDVFRVFSIFKGIGPTASTRKLTGFNIDGHPLETGPAQYFQGPPVAQRHLADVIALLPTGNTPNTCHGSFIGVDTIPRCAVARKVGGQLFT